MIPGYSFLSFFRKTSFDRYKSENDRKMTEKGDGRERESARENKENRLEAWARRTKVKKRKSIDMATASRKITVFFLTYLLSLCTRDTRREHITSNTNTLSLRKEDYLGVLHKDSLVPSVSNLSNSQSLVVSKYETITFHYAENIVQLGKLCFGKLKALKDRENAKFWKLVSEGKEEDLVLEILAVFLYTLASNLLFKFLFWTISFLKGLPKRAMSEKDYHHVSSSGDVPSIVLKDNFSVKTSVRYLQETP